MINNYGCTSDDGKVCNAVPSPGPEPITAMLDMADNLTMVALGKARRISDQVLGSPMPEMKTNDLKCMRDAIDKHVGDLRTLCEELNSIMQGLGV